MNRFLCVVLLFLYSPSLAQNYSVNKSNALDGEELPKYDEMPSHYNSSELPKNVFDTTNLVLKDRSVVYIYEDSIVIRKPNGVSVHVNKMGDSTFRKEKFNYYTEKQDSLYTTKRKDGIVPEPEPRLEESPEPPEIKRPTKSPPNLSGFYSVLVTLFWLILAGGFITIVFLLFRRMSPSSEVKSVEDPIVPVVLNIEEIQEDEFDGLIKEALDAKNYRLAVRYSFLSLLQQLNSKDIIEWEANKTNKQYWRELTRRELATPFKQIYTEFEFIWYGHNEIGEAEFRAVNQRFNEFKTELDRN